MVEPEIFSQMVFSLFLQILNIQNFKPAPCTSQWWSLQALRWARGSPHSPEFHDDKEANDNVDGDINDEDGDDEKMQR